MPAANPTAALPFMPRPFNNRSACFAPAHTALMMLHEDDEHPVDEGDGAVGFKFSLAIVGVDDVAGAISGKHRPRMGEQPAYRVKTLVDSREERSGCRPALAQRQ